MGEVELIKAIGRSDTIEAIFAFAFFCIAIMCCWLAGSDTNGGAALLQIIIAAKIAILSVEIYDDWTDARHIIAAAKQ